MLHCSHGDSHALDDKLKEILRKLDLDDGTFFEKPQDPKTKAVRGSAKKDGRKMDDESGGLIQRMSKIDINKDDKDAEAIIKRAITEKVKVTKEQKSAVFKALTQLKNSHKGDKGSFTLNELRKKVNLSPQEIGAALGELDEAGHMHYDSSTEKIYM